MRLTATRFTIIMTLLLLTAPALPAQDSHVFGVRGGYNSSSLNGGISGELRFNMLNRRFVLNTRYERGLRSVFNISGLDLKMTSYTMTLGFEL